MVNFSISNYPLFFQVLKNPSRPTAKGNYWTVNTGTIPRDLMARQNTHVSRVVQDNGYSYRKDLTEVFDCCSGKIKIDIPQNLFNGTDLIKEPATVMDRLLLEPKNGEPMHPNDGRLGKIYSLVDMFNQDEFIEESQSRPNSGQSTNWPDQKPCNFSPQPRGGVTTASVNKMENNRSTNAPSPYPQHNEMLGRALAGQARSLPLIQALYNNHFLMTGLNNSVPPTNTRQIPANLLGNYRSSGVNSVASSSASPFDASDSGSEDEARKWNQEEARSAPEQNRDPSGFPYMLRNPGLMYGQPSHERHNFSTTMITEEAPKPPQATVKGLFTAFSTRPLEI